MVDNLIYRGTTPTIKLKLNGYDPDLFDLKDAEKIWVTFKSDTYELPVIEKDRLEINNEDKTVIFSMTQEETLSFIRGKAKVQIRFLIGGYAGATKETEVDFGRILKDGVI